MKATFLIEPLATMTAVEDYFFPRQASRMASAHLAQLLPAVSARLALSS